jgi:hypothetical protein
MAIFLITPLANNVEKVDEVVSARLPERDTFKLAGRGGWLVSFPGTSIELSNSLGITGQPEGTAPSVASVLVTSVGAYYGRGSADMWEWLKTRFEAAS